MGFDGSRHAARAVEFAIEEAMLRRARVRVVYAWHPPMLGQVAIGYSPVLAEMVDAEAARFQRWLAAGETRTPVCRWSRPPCAGIPFRPWWTPPAGPIWWSLGPEAVARQK